MWCSICCQAEDFWGIYNHIVRPTDAPFPLDYHLFRQNVKPMWEVRTDTFFNITSFFPLH